jgi:HSP20 family protein
MLYSANFGAPVFSLRREIDRLFDETFGGQGGAASAWTPAVDVRESEEELNLEFELPGVRPEAVEVTAENGVLTVRGEKRAERKESDERGRYHVVERSWGTFQRSFQLPAGIDEDKIEANFDQGVLTVRIPKAALPQPRRIQVKGASASQGEQPRVSGGDSRRESTGERGGERGGERPSRREQPANAR